MRVPRLDEAQGLISEGLTVADLCLPYEPMEPAIRARQCFKC